MITIHEHSMFQSTATVVESELPVHRFRVLDIFTVHMISAHIYFSNLELIFVKYKNASAIIMYYCDYFTVRVTRN